ncbi:MAG: phosphatase PAP2 family protein [Myxococcaceae bacterium]|nr:phosphatase PAP2 family protein [Myxococcaceae bacterium]
MLKVLRPIEWAVLAFIAFVLIRVGPEVFLEYRQLAGLRTVSVFFALGLVAAISLSHELLRLPWPPGAEHAQRLHRASSALAFLPLVVAGVVVLSAPNVWAELSRARTAQVIPMVATLFLRVVGIGLPGGLLWLAAGLELKREGSFGWRRFLARNVADLLHALRDWAPLLFILSAYAWMDAVVGGKLGDDRDAAMAAADRALFGGHDPLELLEVLINRPLSEWLAFTYSFYAVLFPLVLGGVLMVAGRAALRESSFALGAALLLGYVSYSLVPVKGPVLARTFDVSLELYLLASVKEAMMDATRITYDCFPSMHTCCTVLLGWIAWRHVRRLFWWVSPVVVSMPFACVYLRYHYVVDVLAGLTLALAMVKLAPRLSHDAGAPPARLA